MSSFEATLRDFMSGVDFNAPASVFGKLGLALDAAVIRKIQTKTSVVYLATFEFVGLKGDVMMQSRPDNPEDYRFNFFPDDTAKQYTSLANLDQYFSFDKRVDSPKGGVSYVYSHEHLEVIVCADNQKDDPFAVSGLFIHTI